MKLAFRQRFRGVPKADPFPMTADPDGYLGRTACDRALALLERRALDNAGPTALTGPPGLGKTLLLRVLARRLEGRLPTAYLPYSALPPEGLCAWALGELGRSAGANPEARLLDLAAEGRGLLLLLDEASHVPLPTARGLVDLCAESRGALRLQAAATDGVGTGAVLAALGPSLLEVRLSLPMNPSETVSYVRHRLARARAAPETCARFGRDTLCRLHSESGGVPRAVHRLASEVLRPRSARMRLPTAPEEEATAPLLLPAD